MGLPKGKDILHKRNKRVEVFPSYPENTDILDEHLQNDDDVNDAIIVLEIAKKTLKRKRGQMKYSMRSL